MTFFSKSIPQKRSTGVNGYDAVSMQWQSFARLKSSDSRSHQSIHEKRTFRTVSTKIVKIRLPPTAPVQNIQILNVRYHTRGWDFPNKSCLSPCGYCCSVDAIYPWGVQIIKRNGEISCSAHKMDWFSFTHKRRIILHTASLVSSSMTNPEPYKRLRFTFTVLMFFSSTKKSAPPILIAGLSYC